MKYKIIKEQRKAGRAATETVLLESSNRKVAVLRIHFLFSQQLRPWKDNPRKKGFDPKRYEFWALNEATRESIKVRLDSTDV